ncbi:ABC transporter ATP-binding protein/permease [Jonesia quinghaiensis]|uniref:ABC transporter ATP-binding protein/permease n=1 Tax=Jonesia quinghaiensis TaxID=262806 RepID=UPI0003FBA715|nr:ABC transporter ATP-binding protein [Jonesia quinghaiensis]
MPASNASSPHRRAGENTPAKHPGQRPNSQGHTPSGGGHPGGRPGGHGGGKPPTVDPAILYTPQLRTTTRLSAIILTAASVVTALLFVVAGAVIDGYLVKSGATSEIASFGTLSDTNQAPLASLVAGIGPGFGGWLAIALAALAASLTAVGVWVTTAGTAREEAQVRTRIVSHILDVGPVSRASDRSGAIVASATDGAERVAAYRMGFVGPSLASVVSPVLVVVVIALFIDWVTALILLVLIPVIPAAIYGFQKAFRQVSGRSRAQRQALAADYLDALQGLTTLRLMRAARWMQERLAAAGERNRRSVMRLLAVNQVVILVTDAVFFLVMVSALAVLAVVRLQDGIITAGQALALVLLATVLLEPLAKVGSFFYVGLGGRATERGIARFLGTRAPVTGGSSPSLRRDPRSRTEILDDGEDLAPKSRISADDTRPPLLELRNVVCGYGELRVLNGANLTIHQGEHVALTGHSGSGKSTIARIVERSIAPEGGDLLFAGQDATELTLPAARAFSAVVQQTTYLFSGTVRDNLHVAAPDATDDDMWVALEAAHLAADIRDMPGGLDAAVGERGMTLSGGQAQRLSIARALLTDAPLIVLDEPTSQVDLASERAIIAAIDGIVASTDRTVLSISHRASALRTVDRVLNLRDGILTEVTR